MDSDKTILLHFRPLKSSLVGFMIILAFVLNEANAYQILNVSNCGVIVTNDTYYRLTANVSNYVSTWYCFLIASPQNVSNTVIDCQNNTIDSTCSLASTHGIYAIYTSFRNINLTIKNCKITDWYFNNMELYNVGNVTIMNVDLRDVCFATDLSVMYCEDVYGCEVYYNTASFNNPTDNVNITNYTCAVPPSPPAPPTCAPFNCVWEGRPLDATKFLWSQLCRIANFFVCYPIFILIIIVISVVIRFVIRLKKGV